MSVWGSTEYIVERGKKISGMHSPSESEKEPEFDWLQLRDEIRNQDSDGSSQDKFLRKVKENPFVPLGIYTT